VRILSPQQQYAERTAYVGMRPLGAGSEVPLLRGWVEVLEDMVNFQIKTFYLILYATKSTHQKRTA
jgi:hypothetical protein